MKELLQVVKIHFIARAPEGYEVEELTRKQMIKSLQNKKPANTYKEGKDEYESSKKKSSTGEKILQKK